MLRSRKMTLLKDHFYMNELTVIPLCARNCDQCDSDDFELLWYYKHQTKTRHKRWVFDVKNVICKNCGFIFTSPSLDNRYLMNYYADSFSKFQEQRLDYDVAKRLEVIEKFCLVRKLFLEIGANIKTDFHRKIDSIFETVITIEPNDETPGNHENIDNINSKCNCIAHYFVLEHVPNIPDFLIFCSDRLEAGGIMICEVPALEKYSSFISPLLLFEHVNHFTPNSLQCIAQKFGFTEIFTSQEMCSRPFGFVSVFQKTQGELKEFNDYQKNKQLFREGEIAAKELFEKIALIQQVIPRNPSKKIIIWAANETTNRLLTDFSLHENVFIVDSDSRKKDYFDPLYKVYQPTEAETMIRESEIIVICTELHASDIINFLETTYSKKYSPENIYIIDKI